jgi:hypothetical protein
MNDLITINGVEYRRVQQEPTELPPEIPQKGSFWRHKDRDLYIALPCDGRYMANGWRLVHLPSGDTWMPDTGWDGDREEFTAANPPDLSGG